VEEAIARGKGDAPWERTLRRQDPSERPAWSKPDQPHDVKLSQAGVKQRQA